MEAILAETRKINRSIQKSAEQFVDFTDVARILNSSIKANVYIINNQGSLLGYRLLENFECEIMLDEVVEPGIFPEKYNQMLLSIDETKANFEQTSADCVFELGEGCQFTHKITTIIPINAVGERLGTLLLARFSEKFDSNDLILAEYGALTVGMEILRVKNDKLEAEARKEVSVKVALESLSYSELEAIEHIFAELDDEEGIVVASKVADEAGITRSVIVNALRKFESAGVVESRSLGAKGTHIKILNDRLLDKFDEQGVKLI
ncbi:GTP-sensing pleiotropic transcriptional regulator CodY [Fuchsiella alkaliacetigena]|uniref:GTP-sensing pleiotropic transcriptional regulator CodY n=1 Tax=Fuchsiella alkaliacetigena TaxID=957042 RepID=UPI00200AAAC6|nr:GTP-sensing pleiotropic transcriptional regulator CodY [Fuchsiella alkaliacetigena]